MNITFTQDDIQPFLLGRLGDFGLGNPKGILSTLADATTQELEEYVAQLHKVIVEVTDRKCLSCIDGRRCLHNYDGTAPEIRLKHIGGTLALPAVAMTGGALVVKTIDLTKENSVEALMVALEELLELQRSAHESGCGGALGLIEDQEAISVKQAIVEVVDAIMNHEALFAHTMVPYDKDTGKRIQERAGDTVNWLRRHGWDGKEQVEHAGEVSPAGVEVLEGVHQEPAVLVVYSTSGKYTLSVDTLEVMGLGRPFVVNINVSEMIARTLADKDNDQSVGDIMASSIGEHVAGASRLASPQTPVFLVILP